MRIRVSMRNSLPIMSLLVALTMLLTAAPTAARSQIAIGASNPAGSDLSVLDAYIAAVGRKPAMWSLWSNWGSRAGQVDCQPGKGDCAFPTATVAALQARGIDPVIWWLPTDPGNWEAGRYERYKRIINGKHDAYIKQWARDAKQAALASGRPIFIRFAQEAAGIWFPWSIGRFDNTTYRYKKAWRHIHKLFKSVGARKHVRLIWSELKPKKSSYPGDKYVDYVGLTVLNWGPQWTWISMNKRLADRVGMVKKFTKKPIILTETASHYEGGDKASWIRNGYMAAFRKYPKVKGILYLDTDEPHRQLGHPDWRLVKPDDGSALAAYRDIISKWKFKGRLR